MRSSRSSSSPAAAARTVPAQLSQPPRTMRVDGVGETTVPRPEWVDEALAETADRPR
ncbi:hypothetical protein [Halogranum amylolyticum]|uniref:hypothetical protein n=1 Tax=Halogranum amylolyticum TaxID=660520 RepID=UPI000A3F7892|nr:hypothetical protein [Halogranum amylolyticum]